MAALLAKTVGLPALLAGALATVDGVREAYIFGSWAARFEGEPGPPPRDVDVVVVGEADVNDVRDAFAAIEANAGTEIQVVVVDRDRWRRPKKADGFVREVQSRPLVPLSPRVAA